MDDKTRKAIEQVLRDAERVYEPYTRTKKDQDRDDADSPNWGETCDRMVVLKRSAAKLRKLLDGG